MQKKKEYPQTREEWSNAIEQSLGISQAKGEELLTTGKFPVQMLAEWLKKGYSEGFGPNFLPALLRNINGLVTWVYGNKPEPYWPGKNGDLL